MTYKPQEIIEFPSNVKDLAKNFCEYTFVRLILGFFGAGLFGVNLDISC